MVELSYKKKIYVNQEKAVPINYQLIVEDDQYHIECYIENAEIKNPSTYCIIHNITRSKEAALKFLTMISEREVFPIHLIDIYEDYFV